jgi:hypothetical protein
MAMKKFEELYNLVVLSENTITLSQPTDSGLMPAYEKINSFVNGNKVQSISDILGKLSEEELKKANIKKEDVIKIINLTEKSIPGLNNLTVNDLFSPNYFIANLYNSLNNFKKDPTAYNSILEAYKAYKSQPNPDNLTTLIITTNTSNQTGRMSGFLRSTINGILSYMPGTSTISSLLLGSFAIIAPNMLTLSDDFNTIAGSQGLTEVSPGQMITDVAKDSVKNYSVGMVSGAAALAAGGQALDKAKDVFGNVKDKATEITNKVIENQKEQLQKLKDLGLFNKSGSSRTPGSPMVGPKINLRGKIGATGPAQY